MALPGVTINIQDPGLGLVVPGNGRTPALMGICSKGTANAVYSIGSKQALLDTLGQGPLVELAARVLLEGGGPVVCQPLPPSTFGAFTGALTLAGAGTGTVTASKGPERRVSVKIVTGGTLGTAAFQVSIDGAAYGATVTTVNSPPWDYSVPGAPLVKLNFQAGTYVLNDVYAIAVDGVVTRTGSGTATLLNNSTYSPVDAYEVKVKIVTAGGLGVGAFAYSLDGGNSYSGTIAIPSGGVYGIAGTGLVLTFAGTFTVNDIYSGSATAASYTTGEVTTAGTALLADANQWGFLCVVGMPANAAAAASLAAVVSTIMTAAAAAYRYVSALIECPHSESDSTIKTALASFTDARVGICCGDTRMASILTGRFDRRSCMWAAASRASKNRISRDIACVEDGPLIGVTSIYRDEAATPGLDDARFITVRTGLSLGQASGYFLTNGRMFAAPGSDFAYWVNRRVIDEACRVAFGAYALNINKDVRVNKDTGAIDARDADTIDQAVTAKVEAGLNIGTEGASPTSDATAVVTAISRTTNLFTATTIPADVSVTPKGYLRSITATVGLKNPAFSL